MLQITPKKRAPKRIVLYALCFVLIGFYPAGAFATEDSTVTPPSSDTAVTDPPTSPTTSSEPSTTTAPTSSPTSPAPEQPKNYYYDEQTNRWNTDEWKYDAGSGTYIAAPKPVVVTPPAPADTTSNSSSALDSTTTTQIANALDSLAISGSATVAKNTLGGSATSGDSSASATIINNVNSTLSNSNNKQAASFISDITGDVNGDIILQPMLLKAMLEAKAATAQSPANQSITSTTTTGITNDINLTAKSGDATVSKNTTAGSATTGNADTVADVVNIVNSMIAADQSFVGTINIYGNLNGDILIAPDFMAKLLANNSTVVQPGTNSNTDITSTDTQSIVNNVSLAAKSGEAAVLGNTQAGSATSGSADTNVVIFNLSGHDIIASNSLLVFVNVLGKWVGVILDAPTGTTAAALGNNVEKNAVKTQPSLAINAVNTTQLTNNINLLSQTGNASVLSNTRAGNATSGNASAIANIANISNSQLGLSGWFGILFINVYGTWLGSFGVDTAAGTPVVATTSQPGSGQQTVQALSFRPRVGAPRPAVKTTVVSPAGAVEVNALVPVDQPLAGGSDISDAPLDDSTSGAGISPLAVMGSVLGVVFTLSVLYVLRRMILTSMR